MIFIALFAGYIFFIFMEKLLLNLARNFEKKYFDWSK
jgi:hypothetical protein